MNTQPNNIDENDTTINSKILAYSGIITTNNLE